MPSEVGNTFCYNKGCGKKFELEKNDDGSCKFHPGQPVFHDAYKGWGCCNKKVTDFTEFLNIPGCTVGPHNPEKPPEPEKKAIVQQGEREGEEVVVETKAKAPPTAAARDAKDEPMVELTKKVNASLKQLLDDKLREEAEKSAAPAVEAEGSGPVEIEPGTPCKNNACGRAYDPTKGMKFWSCCNKKTSDFEAFLSQPGCTRGDHKWIADESEGGGEIECRDDFHQTGSHVILTYYLKKSHPGLTTVSGNPVKLRVCLASLEGGRKETEIDLWGAVVIGESKVTLTPNKIEISLRKADPVSWSRLDFVPPPKDDE